MNIFAGVMYGELKGDSLVSDEKFKIIKSGEKLLYLLGETKINSSKELVELFSKGFKKVESYDISISTEDKIWINEEKFNKLTNFVKSNYEQLRFVGLSFDKVLEEYKNDAICVREAENIFGQKSVKVDLFPKDFLGKD